MVLFLQPPDVRSRRFFKFHGFKQAGCWLLRRVCHGVSLGGGTRSFASLRATSLKLPPVEDVIQDLKTQCEEGRGVSLMAL